MPLFSIVKSHLLPPSTWVWLVDLVNTKVMFNGVGTAHLYLKSNEQAAERPSLYVHAPW